MREREREREKEKERNSRQAMIDGSTGEVLGGSLRGEAGGDKADFLRTTLG